MNWEEGGGKTQLAENWDASDPALWEGGESNSTATDKYRDVCLTFGNAKHATEKEPLFPGPVERSQGMSEWHAGTAAERKLFVCKQAIILLLLVLLLRRGLILWSSC